MTGWSLALVAGCAQRQTAILEHAARLVRFGGRLVYSTCTFVPEEDEAVIARFLDEHIDFDLVEPAPRSGLSPGRPDWLAEPRGGDAAGNVSATVRLWPHTGPGEGHFVAVLERRSELAPSRYGLEPPAAGQAQGWLFRSEPALRRSKRSSGGLCAGSRLPRATEMAYAAFCAANLTATPANERLALVGSYLYVLTDRSARPHGSPLPPSGMVVGTLHKDRFEPSHALALGIGLMPRSAPLTCPLTAQRCTPS